MNPLFHTEFSISDSLKNVRKSVLIYETIIYPVEKNAQMWSMSGSIAASGTFKLSYYIDTTGGQSGSPVYKNDGNYRCVGIHTNYNSLGYNQAERIDESLFDIMNQYR